MKVTLWGTRGSQASPGPDTVRYGGNTSSVEISDQSGHVLVLDAGTGIRRLGLALGADVQRVDILLTHLHMDHIQGLGFFGPLFRPSLEVHIWGPPSTTLSLRSRLSRYLSPPLFPVRLRDLPCQLTVHDVPLRYFDIPGFAIAAELVRHPGPTVGYRIEANGVVVTYLPDHEPALGVPRFPRAPEWTSGFDLASGANVLIHDAQYLDAEYGDRVGWGHSTIAHAIAFADLADVERLVLFHHDPAHDDAQLDDAFAAALSERVLAAREGMTLTVG